MASTTKFGADNRGTIACMHCGRLTWEQYSRTKGVNGETCGDCAVEFEAENEHLDYNGQHTFSREHEAACPICHPERREARMAKVAAHNAKLQINVENRTREAREKANRKTETQAAKDAATKFCKAPGCDYGSDGRAGRASKTSDYCTICRPYNPHAATKLSKDDREMFARRDWNTDACGTCGKAKTDEIHTGR